MKQTEGFDVIVLGAGPAGLTAAAAAARRGLRTLLVDKASGPGVKLLIAGGGKGNITNTRIRSSDYVGENPQFVAAALAGYPPQRLLARLAKAGVAVEEREQGRIFCARSAREVLNMLLADLPPGLCRAQYRTAVLGLGRRRGVFTVQTPAGAFQAGRVIAATGSPAWPQCGADSSGLVALARLGHRILPARPVLAPLVLPAGSPLLGLSGLSAEAAVSCSLPGAPVFSEPVLFTHQGVSGPAVLQISCYWREGAEVSFDFLPRRNLREILDAAVGKATPLSILSRLLPDRLCRALVPEPLLSRRVAELSKAQRQAVRDSIQAVRVRPVRSGGLERAEAAAGGVDTNEVNPQTLESLVAPGLFFCGEVLDIAGRLGGYNLHWAWASGTLAGESVCG